MGEKIPNDLVKCETLIHITIIACKFLTNNENLTGCFTTKNYENTKILFYFHLKTTHYKRNLLSVFWVLYLLLV